MVQKTRTRYAVVIVYTDGEIDVAGDDDSTKCLSLYDSLASAPPDGVASVGFFERGSHVKSVQCMGEGSGNSAG